MSQWCQLSRAQDIVKNEGFAVLFNQQTKTAFVLNSDEFRAGATDRPDRGAHYKLMN